MKKLLAVVLFLIAPIRIHAAITDPEVLQEKSVLLFFSTTVAAASNANFDLISLSTSANLFPHLDTGEIDTHYIHIVVDKIAAATATVKIGVVNFVNTSTGSVTFFYEKVANRNVSNTVGSDMFAPEPAFVRCKVRPNNTALTTDVDGLTPFILSNDKLSGSALYHSTTTATAQLNSPVGLISPRVGDIIMQVLTDSSNPVNVIVNIAYHSEP